MRLRRDAFMAEDMTQEEAERNQQSPHKYRKITFVRSDYDARQIAAAQIKRMRKNGATIHVINLEFSMGGL